jgi:hypothetical protein
VTPEELAALDKAADTVLRRAFLAAFGASPLRNYTIQVEAAVAAYKEMQRDWFLYGEHFRGRAGRVDPTRVWTLDKGRTWIDAPTGEQVTRFSPGGLP